MSNALMDEVARARRSDLLAAAASARLAREVSPRPVRARRVHRTLGAWLVNLGERLTPPSPTCADSRR